MSKISKRTRGQDAEERISLLAMISDGIWSPRPAWWASGFVLFAAGLALLPAVRHDYEGGAASFRARLIEYHDGYFHPEFVKGEEVKLAWDIEVFVFVRRDLAGVRTMNASYSAYFRDPRNRPLQGTQATDAMLLAKWNRIEPALRAALRERQGEFTELLEAVDPDGLGGWLAARGPSSAMTPGVRVVYKPRLAVLKRVLYFTPGVLMILGVAAGLARVVWRGLVRKAQRRLGSGVCSRCEYPFPDNAGVCPECGLIGDDERARLDWKLAPWRRRWRIARA